jgi:hypothetical protein
MAEIFVKRTGSDLNGNYWGMNIRRIRIQLDTEKVYAEARKEFKDSTDAIITAKEWKNYELPDSAYGSLLTLTNWVDAQVNAPEPEPDPEV